MNSTAAIKEEIVRLGLTELIPSDNKNSDEEIELRIGMVIQQLLKNDTAALANLLYRIDVREQLVNEAFKGESLEAIAAVIARRIVERLKQKIELRKKYSS